MPIFSWIQDVTPFVVLAIICVVLAGLFSLIKIVFLALSVTTDNEENEKLVNRVNAYVDAHGFNESISIARTFLNLLAGVLGFVAASRAYRLYNSRRYRGILRRLFNSEYVRRNQTRNTFAHSSPDL